MGSISRPLHFNRIITPLLSIAAFALTLKAVIEEKPDSSKLNICDLLVT